jgi:Predicted aminopeptidases
MKRLTIVFLSLAIVSAAFADSSTIVDNLRSHLSALASDAMNGRAAGSADGRRAAAYVYSQLESIGLRPEYQAVEGTEFRNVIATIPSRNGKYILIGAHYDHLGKRFGRIYNGADDNASGTSALIEVARMLAGRELECGIVFAAFDAEEIGLVGSKYCAAHLDNDVGLMISMDMVGHLKDEGRLIYEGTGTIVGGAALVESVKVAGLSAKSYAVAKEAGVLTDTFYFSKRKIPAINVSTGYLESNYHKPSDDIEYLDVEGMGKVVEHVAGFVEAAQASLAPTGVALYGNKAPSLGFSVAGITDGVIGDGYLSGAEALVDSIGIRGTLPLNYYDLFGSYSLYGGVEFDIGSVVKSGGVEQSLGFTLPLGIEVSSRISSFELLVPLALYYRYSSAEGLVSGLDDWANHEFGVQIGEHIRFNTGIDILDHIGIGFDVRQGARGLDLSSLSAAATTKSIAFTGTYFF